MLRKAPQLADAPLPLTRNPRADAQIPTSPGKRGEVGGRVANSFTRSAVGECCLDHHDGGRHVVRKIGLELLRRSGVRQFSIKSVSLGSHFALCKEGKMNPRGEKYHG